MNLTFGEKIKEARKAKKLTQKQLADKIGAAHNSISDWENNKNKPDPDTIELLCGVLEISPNYLLTTDSDDFSPSEKILIKKYRKLDDYGKKAVDNILDQEVHRCSEIKLWLKNDSISIYKKGNLSTEQERRIMAYWNRLQVHQAALNAAHGDEESTQEDRNAGDAIMEDDSEWK